MRSYGIVPEEAAEHGKVAHLGKFAENPVITMFFASVSPMLLSTLRGLLTSGADVPRGSHSDYPVLQRIYRLHCAKLSHQAHVSQLCEDLGFCRQEESLGHQH